MKLISETASISPEGQREPMLLVWLPDGRRTTVRYGLRGGGRTADEAYEIAHRLAVGAQPSPAKASGITFYPHQDDYTNHGPKSSTRVPRKRGSTIKGEHHRIVKMLLSEKRLNPGDEVKTSSCTLRELLAVAAHMDFTSEQTGRQRGRIFLHRLLDPLVARYIKDKFGVTVVSVRFDDEALEAVA